MRREVRALKVRGGTEKYIFDSGLLLRNKLLCQEAGSTVINVYEYMKVCGKSHQD